jgi:membrane protein involved in colicin uptake
MKFDDDDDVDARRDGGGYGGGHDVGRRHTMTNAMTTIAAMKAKATMGTKSSSAADKARLAVMSAMANNAVLSDLFGGTKDGGETRHGGSGGDGVRRTEKERRDALFTRNC